MVVSIGGSMIPMRKVFRFFWKEPLTGQTSLYGALPDHLR